MAADDPVIITVAPTGPLTTQRESSGSAGDAGADRRGGRASRCARERPSRTCTPAVADERPTADPAVYAEIAREIRARCDIVVQASTGVGLDVSCEDRVKIIASGEVDVTMATLNPASMTFGQGTFSNPPWFVERLAELMDERGIRPELEVYDFGHVGLCKDLVKRGLVHGPLQFSFVMGVRGGMPGDPALLPALIPMLPEGSIWQAIGIGRAQLPLSFAALALGGNIRVGFRGQRLLPQGRAGRVQRPIRAPRRRPGPCGRARGRDPELRPRAAGGQLTMAERLVIANGRVLRPDGCLHVSDVLVEDGSIAALQAGLDHLDAERLDADGMLVVPGLVNAHMHSGENFNPGVYENLPLDVWFVRSHQVTRHEPPSREAIYVRTLLGAALMLASGTTTAVDFLYEAPAITLDTLEPVVQAYRDAGLRATILLGVADLPFAQSLPLDGQAEAAAHEAAPPTFDSIMELARAAVERWHEPGGLIGIGLGPVGSATVLAGAARGEPRVRHRA